MNKDSPRRIVVGISGSSGAVYGARLVDVLSTVPDVETHLIVTSGAKATLEFETNYSLEEVLEFADVVYEDSQLGAVNHPGSCGGSDP